MSDRRLADATLLEFSEEQPIVLAGEPRALRGRVRLRNAGQEKLVLREAWIRPVAPERGASLGVATQLSLVTTLQPGQDQQLSLTLDLDRYLPPGEYHADLEVAGRRQPIVLHVAETVRLSVSPQPVVIDQPAGASVRKRVILSNEGNVPLTIGEVGTVRLAVELPPGYAARPRIAVSDSRSESSRRSLGGVIEQIGGSHPRRVMRQIADMEVRPVEAPAILEPGESRSLELEIRLPEELEANRRYYGRAPLYTSDLEFVIVPPSGGQPPRKHQEGAQRAPGRAQRPKAGKKT
jgi:hypothetical protein